MFCVIADAVQTSRHLKAKLYSSFIMDSLSDSWQTVNAWLC